MLPSLSQEEKLRIQCSIRLKELDLEIDRVKHQKETNKTNGNLPFKVKLQVYNHETNEDEDAEKDDHDEDDDDDDAEDDTDEDDDAVDINEDDADEEDDNDDDAEDDTDKDDDDADDDDHANSETCNSDKSGEESEEEKPYYFDMYVHDSDDDEDYIPKQEWEKQQKQKPKNVEKLRIKSPELSQTLSVDSSKVMSKARPLKVLGCYVCLGDISETDDEIAECDNCGVAIHEDCYGISDSQSAASTESSTRTEPWFCDVCKAGVKPTCEL